MTLVTSVPTMVAVTEEARDRTAALKGVNVGCSSSRNGRRGAPPPGP